jgi:hypothetical protein
MTTSATGGGVQNHPFGRSTDRQANNQIAAQSGGNVRLSEPGGGDRA